MYNAQHQKHVPFLESNTAKNSTKMFSVDAVEFITVRFLQPFEGVQGATGRGPRGFGY